MAFLRLTKNTPIKNMNFLFNESLLSNEFKNNTLNNNRISEILHYLVENRSKIIDLCREDICSGGNILFDITSI